MNDDQQTDGDREMTVASKLTHGFHWNKESQFVTHEVTGKVLPEETVQDAQEFYGQQALTGLFDLVDRMKMTLQDGDY